MAGLGYVVAVLLGALVGYKVGHSKGSKEVIDSTGRPGRPRDEDPPKQIP